jgi:DNA-binding transcriptional LysR family regulator
MNAVRRLTLEQLRAFVSIAEASSFTEAARRQMRTQTAMTRQIKSMEDALGQRVFRRTRGHVEGLTDVGQHLLPYARRVLATIDDAWMALSRPSVSGSIRVGVMDDVDVGWLNELIARFRAAQPDCDVRAISDFSTRLEQRLEIGEIDLAVVKKLAVQGGPTREGLVYREPLLWAAGPGFRCDPRKPVPIVVFHEGCVYRAHILESLKKYGVASFVAYEGQSYANVRTALSAGPGISALTKSQIKAAGLHQIFDINGVPPGPSGHGGHRYSTFVGADEVSCENLHKRDRAAYPGDTRICDVPGNDRGLKRSFNIQNGSTPGDKRRAEALESRASCRTHKGRSHSLIHRIRLSEDRFRFSGRCCRTADRGSYLQAVMSPKRRLLDALAIRHAPQTLSAAARRQTHE